MKLINSVKKSRYKKIDTIFISDYKWEFLAFKYCITLNARDWEELETEYRSNDYTGILYGDETAKCCLEIFNDYSYKDIERLLKNNEITLYSNEDKDFHILVKNDY